MWGERYAKNVWMYAALFSLYSGRRTQTARCMACRKGSVPKHLIRALRRRSVRIAPGWRQDDVRMASRMRHEASGWRQDGVRKTSGNRQDGVRMASG